MSMVCQSEPFLPALSWVQPSIERFSINFEQLMVGRQGSDLDTLLAVFQDAWESYDDQNIRYGAGESRDDIGQMAKKMLTEFLKSDFSRPQGEIIAIEEELRGQVVPGCPELLARVDLIVDTGSEVIVSDFKTSRCAWNNLKIEDLAPQLYLYSELVKPLADGKPIKLAFAVLTKTKVPVLTVHDVPLDPHQVERTKRIVENIWRAIESGHILSQSVANELWHMSFPDTVSGVDGMMMEINRKEGSCPLCRTVNPSRYKGPQAGPMS